MVKAYTSVVTRRSQYEEMSVCGDELTIWRDVSRLSSKTSCRRDLVTTRVSVALKGRPILCDTKTSQVSKAQRFNWRRSHRFLTGAWGGFALLGTCAGSLIRRR